MKFERLAVIGAAVFVVAVLAAGGAAGNDLVTLTVSVTDQDDEPVGGVEVVATWETESGETRTATGTTASNGKVFLDVPEDATVELDVDDDTYIRNRPRTVERASESEVEVTVSRSGTATVSVVDTRDRPQADARVRVREGGRTVDRGQTDESGTFTSSRLERGTYTLRVVKPGFFEATQEVTVNGEGNATVEIERGEVVLDLRVFDDHFDPPTEIETGAIQVRSSVYNAEVTVTEGSASLNVPVNAEYTAEIIKDGYDPAPETITVREADVSANVTAQRTPTLSLTTANERVLVGETTRVSVRNAYDEPVEGATIEVDGTAVGETDARGELAVPIDAPGEQTVVAIDGDVRSESITIVGVGEDDVIDEGDDAGEADDANETDDSGETDDGAPGFGVVVAVAALLGAAAVGARRGNGPA
ncbi:carboxypeptidase regulatory-like domain-containing protein [Halorubrum sp. DTA46]|uniref:carboxypeptidase regulatory-like domain-containing protein n=1 Tax=Halorubrum sp. DTA46 TaxID=3402162 RepID=UPI003AAA7E62